ncbi:MAG: DUF4922 domain-containing protein [Ignavibacteriales bacterium]|nr:DUF4922 domain-containing protein [Ignavibacteriales bacterium]
MTSRRIFSVHSESTPRAELIEACKNLLDDQRRSWPQCGEGYAALESIRVKEIACRGFSVHLQFNPKRIVSTGAKVDAAAIRQRLCFLCEDNLPAQQRGILYRNEFLILCNPAPIFHQHFTVSLTRHQPQVWEPFLDPFFALSKDLGPIYSVFYNGAKCGASAPDHAHVQVCPKDAIPVEKDARDPRRRKKFFDRGSTAILTLKEYGRPTLVFESTDAIELKVIVRRLLAAAQQVLGIADEPMLNAICTYRDGVWRLIVFLRSKHRPESYFKEGAEQLFVSPAAVDIGGLIVTPREQDFERLDVPTVENLFDEVCLAPQVVEQIAGLIQ